MMVGGKESKRSNNIKILNSAAADGKLSPARNFPTFKTGALTVLKSLLGAVAFWEYRCPPTSAYLSHGVGAAVVRVQVNVTERRGSQSSRLRVKSRADQ